MELYHFSEEPHIRKFEPRKAQSQLDEPAMVWAIDEFHSPHYYFPRDCPRICIWPNDDTTESDRIHFFGHSKTNRIIAVETRWVKRLRNTQLYRYFFESNHFTIYDANAGYYTSTRPVEPTSIQRMDDLLGSLTQLDIELRITPSLTPLKESVLSSTVSFSMIRMRNAIDD